MSRPIKVSRLGETEPESTAQGGWNQSPKIGASVEKRCKCSLESQDSSCERGGAAGRRESAKAIYRRLRLEVGLRDVKVLGSKIRTVILHAPNRNDEVRSAIFDNKSGLVNAVLTA